MRVLLTGHEGYIGAVAAPVLAAAGHEVVGLDTGLYRGCDFGDPPPPIPAIVRDVRDVTADDVSGFDAVVHLAAVSNDPVGQLDPDATFAINHRASVRLARLARDAGVGRFVFASSCSLYGASSVDAPLAEDADFNPVTAYGESKVLAERDISELATDGFSPVFLRNATVYGVSPRLRGDVVVNNLVGVALATGEVRMRSDGTPWRPLVHVADVCRVITGVLAAPAPIVHNQALNVCASTENYRIREVAEIVRDATPGTELSFAAEAAPDLRDYRVSGDRLARLLPGAVPRLTVADGVGELVTAMRAVGMGPGEIDGPRYTRLRRIRELMDAGTIDRSLRRSA